MSGCIFCKIAEKTLPAKVIYEDDDCLAFEDLNPQAPVHFLVIPKAHIETILDADPEIMGKLVNVAARTAENKGVAEDGFRTVVNCRRHAGQTVDHLHVHVLGGRWFTWPPG
ncbi:MAG: histidine triad nucleotide-binding protein [candidate division Zixibacteria bacterium]